MSTTDLTHINNGDQMSDPMTEEATPAATSSIKEEVTPKKKRKREKRPPDPTDPAYIAAAAAVETAKIEAEQAAIREAEEAAIPTPMENCKYYTSLGMFVQKFRESNVILVLSFFPHELFEVVK